MAKQITIDEMAEIMTRLGLPEGEVFKGLLVYLGARMADIIAKRLDIDHNPPRADDIETMAPFWANYPKQPMPDVLEDFDPEATEEWSTRGEQGVPPRSDR